MTPSATSRRRRSRLAVVAGLLATLGCGGTDGPDDAGNSGAALSAAPLPPFGAPIDTTYGGRFLVTPSCLVVARVAANAPPEVLFFDRTGRSTGSFARRGSGPGEVQSIDGLSAAGDTIVVWDRGNGRLTLLGCDGGSYGAHTIALAGVELAAATSRHIAFGLDPASPAYAIWLVDGLPGDTLGPRLTPRRRAARDLLLPDPDGGVAVLDVSGGLVIHYPTGGRTPTRVDTLPPAVRARFEEVFKRVWADEPVLMALPEHPMYVANAQLLPGRRLLLGQPGHQGTTAWGGVIVSLAAGTFEEIAAPADSLKALGLFTGRSASLVGDTLFALSLDSIYRYRIVTP